jgi:hypothetical protein
MGCPTFAQPGNMQSDNGICYPITSNAQSISSYAMLWFRSTSLVPAPITPTSVCNAVITDTVVQNGGFYNYQLSCVGAPGLVFNGVLTVTSVVNGTSFKFAQMRLPTANTSMPLSSASLLAISNANAFVDGLTVSAQLTAGCAAKNWTMYNFTSREFGTNLSYTGNNSDCMQLQPVDASTAIVYTGQGQIACSFFFSTRPTAAMAVTTIGPNIDRSYLAQVNCSSAPNNFSTYVVRSSPTVFVRSILTIIPPVFNSTPVLYTPMTAQCAASVYPSIISNPVKFAVPFYINGTIGIAWPTPQTFPQFVLNYTLALASLLQVPSYRVFIPTNMIRSATTAEAAAGASVIMSYWVYADPFMGENSTLTDTVRALVLRMNQLATTGGLADLWVAPLYAPITPVISWRCPDKVTFASWCPKPVEPTTASGGASAPISSSASVAVKVSVQTDVSIASSLTWKNSFAAAVAQSLSIDVSRVEIAAVTAGSAVVQVVILPPVTSTNIVSSTVPASSLATTLVAV